MTDLDPCNQCSHPQSEHQTYAGFSYQWCAYPDPLCECVGFNVEPQPE